MTSVEAAVAPLSLHVAELRRVVVWSVAAWLCALALTAYYYQPLVELLLEPYRQAVVVRTAERGLWRRPVQVHQWHNEGSTPVWHTTSQTAVAVGGGARLEKEGYWIPPGGSVWLTEEQASPLLVLSPTEGFVVALKVCLWAALFLSAPLWGYAILVFIAPALTQAQQRYLAPFAAAMFSLTSGALALAYWIALPLANSYLLAFNADLGTNSWQLERYIDYSLLLLVAHGCAGVLGAFMFFALHTGLLQAHILAQYRRHALLGSFILAALLTPPDVYTQVLVGLPLYAFFEMSIWYGYWLHPQGFENNR